MDSGHRAALIASAEAFMERYHDAFLHGTRDDIQALVHSPVAYITETDVQLRERYPFDPAKLRATSGVDHVTATTTFVHIDDQRAHVLIEATRRRADGSPIEQVQSVYILQDRGDGWRVAAFSGIRTPVDGVGPA